jgi:hypothetical protein
MERGFHRAGDVENRLGYYVGQLGAALAPRMQSTTTYS